MNAQSYSFIPIPHASSSHPTLTHTIPQPQIIVSHEQSRIDRIADTKLLLHDGQSKIFKIKFRTTQKILIVKQSSRSLKGEYKILKQLRDSPYICHVKKYYPKIGNGREENFILMEYYHHKDLSHFMKQTHHHLQNIRLQKILIYKFLVELTEALLAVHAKGFIHGNLNSKNIFVGKDLGVRIGDFSSASLQLQPTTNQLICSPGYVAPEVESGCYTQAIDVFSLGCILLDIITLKSDSENRSLESIPVYYSEFKRLYQMLTQRTPEDRPTAYAFRNELQHLQFDYQNLIKMVPLSSPSSLQSAESPVESISVFQVKIMTEFIPKDICRMILQYCTEWEPTPQFILSMPDQTYGISGIQGRLYICSSSLLHLDLTDKITTINNLIPEPDDVDIDTKRSLVYLVNQTDVFILKLNHETHSSSWKLPLLVPSSYRRGIKVDQSNFYFVMEKVPKIFVCEASDGSALKQCNLQNGQYVEHNPRGLTLDDQVIYVCDRTHHCIHRVKKHTGVFQASWGQVGTELGQFSFPYSIYYDLEGTFYIGDSVSVQLFSKEGLCYERLGLDSTQGSGMNQFDGVFGIIVLNGKLYVSDGCNHRIQVFRRT